MVRIRDDARLLAAIQDMPDELPLHLVADAHAAKTGDALRHVHMNVGMRRIRLCLPNGCKLVPRRRNAVFPEITVKFFFGKILDRLCRITMRKKSQQRAPGLFHPGRVCLDHHSACHRRGARCRVSPPVGDLDFTETTRATRFQSLIVAERRHLEAKPVQRIENRQAGRKFMCAAVDGDARASPPPF